MAYYVRFIAKDSVPDLGALSQGVPKLAPDLGFEDTSGTGPDARPSADVKLGADVVAEVEINLPGDEVFADDVAELTEDARDGKGDVETVVARLQSARAMLCLRLLSGGRDFYQTLEAVDPIWEWLDQHHDGMLQFDEDGFYLKEDKVLETE